MDLFFIKCPPNIDSIHINIIRGQIISWRLYSPGKIVVLKSPLAKNPVNVIQVFVSPKSQIDFMIPLSMPRKWTGKKYWVG